MNFRWIAITFAATMGLAAAERFDMKVRDDFFAGFAGNKEAMDRAMANSENALRANPKHAEALVWHGAGVFFQSAAYFQSGDAKKGMELFAQGQKEMDDAVALEPDSIGVLIPRGAALMQAGRHILGRNPELGKQVLGKALSDYQHAYDLQQTRLAQLGKHTAGELLFGIADTNSRLGNQERAAEFFDKISSTLPDTVYAKRAAMWKETKSLPLEQTGCVGCHSAALK